MAAFDRILSGVAGMDQALDSIRLGDNVVLQVSKLEDYVFLQKLLQNRQFPKKEI